ncbi:GntR family transcriptional regulator [Solitalea lacus]|uniref:GntR family transcriptional regulator n=1 Tax=Solitalea lacus TaxID=2911172 RepID=UPI001EDADD86|nr:GntR family transcriptional regulator [Solitalea lacus]UKJ08686.1 GntR family transcriptional regulator [Solitalea lacus]
MKNQTKKSIGKTLSIKVADKIRQEIIFGHYKEGERIIEQSISEEFGVSRIPVREAIRLLESEGFIELSPYKGSIVREITPEAFKETHLIRLTIVPVLLQYAIPNYSSKTIKQAEDLINKTESKLSETALLQFIVKMHDIMYGPCNMPYILNLSEVSLKRHLTVLNIYFNSFDLSEITLDRFRNFFELCKQKKYQEARDYWIKTLTEQYQLITEEFNKWHDLQKISVS